MIMLTDFQGEPCLVAIDKIRDVTSVSYQDNVPLSRVQFDGKDYLLVKEDVQYIYEAIQGVK